MSAEENKTEAPTEEAKPKGSIEEWPESVDSRCIHLAVNDLTKHIFLKEEDAYMAVIWLCHSMMFEAWDKTPRLIITAPMKNCGKSTLLNALADMADRGIEAGSCTPSAFVSYAAQQNQLFIIDEADARFGKHGHSEMTTVLNVGYEKGKPYHKATGDNHQPTEFPVFSSALLAGVGLENKMSETTLSRCLIIPMSRAKKGQIPNRYKRRKHQPIFNDHGRKLKRWVMDNKEVIAKRDPDFKADLDGRIEDNWEPLLAIAEIASIDLAKMIRKMAWEEDNILQDDQGMDLIRDAFKVYGWLKEREQLPPEWDHSISDKGIASTALQEQMVQFEQFDGGGDRQWSNYYPDRPVDQRYILARDITKIFNDFGIKKKSIRAGDTSIKAFAWGDIEDTYNHYFDDDPSIDQAVNGSAELDEWMQDYDSSVVDVVNHKQGMAGGNGSGVRDEF